MANTLDYLPEIEGDEAIYIGQILKEFDDNEAQKFTNVYRARRKDPQTILISCILGFLGFAGIHRLLLNQIGMGILYIFTGGLCLIGTIVDLVNYRDMTFEYNREVAQNVRSLIK